MIPSGPHHLTRNGSHVDSKTMCGLRVSSGIWHFWVEMIHLRGVLFPGHTADKCCPECFEAAGVTPWPDAATAYASVPRPVPSGQLKMLGDVA